MKITTSTAVTIVLSVVLLSSLFYVGVTSSIAVYDPYADYDQDGDVDIFDVVPMAEAYGTTGDATRNVTVTNWPDWWLCIPSNGIDVVETTLLEWTGNRQEGTESEFGAMLWHDRVTCLFPFKFIPKSTSYNVTDLWIVVTEAVPIGGETTSFNIKVNDNLTVSSGDYEHLYRYVPHVRTIHVTDTAVCNLIRIGTNTIEFSNPQPENQLYVFRITLLVEYEYSA